MTAFPAACAYCGEGSTGGGAWVCPKCESETRRMLGELGTLWGLLEEELTALPSPRLSSVKIHQSGSVGPVMRWAVMDARERIAWVNRSLPDPARLGEELRGALQERATGLVWDVGDAHRAAVRIVGNVPHQRATNRQCPSGCGGVLTLLLSPDGHLIKAACPNGHEYGRDAVFGRIAPNLRRNM